MKHKTTIIAVLIAAVVISALPLIACRSDSNDVPTLKDTKSAPVDAPGAPKADAADPLLDNEAKMMALTECLREQGIEVLDPVVDADGNVDKPEFAEGVEYDKETMGQAWEACEHHLEGFIWEKENVDVSEQVDQYIALATCLREKNYDLDDPTAETLDAWIVDFKTAIDWDDPAAVADYEACTGETVGKGDSK
jgi:hypothetical protein